MNPALRLLCALVLCAATRAQVPLSNPGDQGNRAPNSAQQNRRFQNSSTRNSATKNSGAQNADRQNPSVENFTAPQAPVALQDEPHHRIVLQNDFVRVFSVSVPPLDATLLHQHNLPYIGIMLGPGDLVNVVLGKPEVHVTLQDGDTRYFGTPYAHLVRTDAGLPFWNITVELLRPQGTARNMCRQVMEGPLGACPQQTARGRSASQEAGDDDVPYFETDEIRIDQVKVAQGRDYVDATPKLNALLVALTNANLDAGLGGEHVLFLHAGNVLWLPAGLHRKVVDFLGTKSGFVLISFKDSAGAAKP